jgi:hypothetical protein
MKSASPEPGAPDWGIATLPLRCNRGDSRWLEETLGLAGLRAHRTAGPPLRGFSLRKGGGNHAL